MQQMVGSIITCHGGKLDLVILFGFYLSDHSDPPLSGVIIAKYKIYIYALLKRKCAEFKTAR